MIYKMIGWILSQTKTLFMRMRGDIQGIPIGRSCPVQLGLDSQNTWRGKNGTFLYTLVKDTLSTNKVFKAWTQDFLGFYPITIQLKGCKRLQL